MHILKTNQLLHFIFRQIPMMNYQIQKLLLNLHLESLKSNHNVYKTSVRSLTIYGSSYLNIASFITSKSISSIHFSDSSSKGIPFNLSISVYLDREQSIFIVSSCSDFIQLIKNSIIR